MDEIIDKRFERVEKALAKLIGSLSTYNPSTNDANDLVAADAELSQGLEQLSTHQANYAKTLALRTTSEQLDTQIRDTLTLLTNTREELLSSPSTNFPTSANPVSYDELLSYARRISKFTLPATHRERDPQSNTDTGDRASNTPKEPGSHDQSNGTSTPVTGANGLDTQIALGSSMEVDSATPTTQQPSHATNTNSQTALPAEWITHINPEANMPFIPWPTEDTIRRGALASIEILINKGIDPATFDPEKSAELEEERKGKQEEEDRAREVERERMEEGRRMEFERRMSTGGHVAVQQQQAKPAAFALNNFDDDDEDEE